MVAGGVEGLDAIKRLLDFNHQLKESNLHSAKSSDLDVFWLSDMRETDNKGAKDLDDR